MFKCVKLTLLILFFPLAASVPAQAALPAPTGYVNDFAQVMDAQSRDYLERMLTAFEQKSGHEIAVVTVPTLEERPIEDYAVELYQKWGLGKKGKDDGLLLLIAPVEREVRIEVGYGLEGVINDALAGRIIRQKIIPEFKLGNFGLGALKGTIVIVGLIADKEGINFDFQDFGGQAELYQQAKKKKGPLHTIGAIFFIILLAYLFIRHPWLFLFFLAASFRSGGGRGGFGGGFGGFGGGLSGGGGASGRW